MKSIKCHVSIPIKSGSSIMGALTIPLILYTLYILPVYAVCNTGETQTDLGCLPADPGHFASTLYGWGLGLVGAVALLFIIYGSFMVLSSQGDPVKLQNGKSYIVYSLIGLSLAVGGYAFYKIVTSDIIKLQTVFQ